MNYAIIGKGFIYPRHVQAIEATGGKVLMTCDIDPTKEPDFIDWLSMYRSPQFKEVDTVVICTPNYLHAPMTREALVRKKKVICEKPLYLNDEKKLDGVTPVLQLRYHPALKGLNVENVYVQAKMYRDEKYWNSWKGDELKSGGLLYNLGVHYIDLLIVLLGKPKRVLKKELLEKCATATIKFERGIGQFHIEIVDSKDEQGRFIIADGQEVNLSNQENLSYEDLHKYVYEAFLRGEGLTVKDAKPALDLINKLCCP